MPINIALTAFDVCALFAVIGVLACRMAVVPCGMDRGLDTRVLRLLGLGILLLTLSSIGILLSRLLELDGGSWEQLRSTLAPALKFTHYGHVWPWRIPALVLLWTAWGWVLRHRDHTWAAWLMTIAVAGIALTRSETGHPADHGDFTIAVWADWVHLMAGATWVGSLFGMSLVVFPRLLSAGDAALAQSAMIFRRLSALSGTALALVVAAGIYTAIGQLGSFSGLWTSGYGIALDVKLLIVIAMIALGAHNRYFKLPRLMRAAGRPPPGSMFGKLLRRYTSSRNPGQYARTAIVRSCARAVLAESLLGLAVIAAASVLLHNMPPADMPKNMPGMSMQMQTQAHAAAPAASITAATIGLTTAGTAR